MAGRYTPKQGVIWIDAFLTNAGHLRAARGQKYDGTIERPVKLKIEQRPHKDSVQKLFTLIDQKSKKPIFERSSRPYVLIQSPFVQGLSEKLDMILETVSYQEAMNIAYKMKAHRQKVNVSKDIPKFQKPKQAKIKKSFGAPKEKTETPAPAGI